MTVKTKFGDITVKRRLYVCFDEETNKNTNCYPLDEELGLKIRKN
jgi:hypothetical protein